MRTRLIALAVTVTAVGGLSGCGSGLGPDVHPGRAAVVGGETVTFEQVDDLTDQFCAWQLPGLASRKVGWPLSYLRTFAVDSFVDGVVVREFAEEQDVDSDAAWKLAEQQADGVAAQEAERGPGMGSAVVAFFARLQFEVVVLESVGRALVGPQATVEEAVAAGTESLDAFRQDVEVSIDPRFGTLEKDNSSYRAPAGLLSVRSGDGLRDITDPDEFDQDYVKSLPRSQRCG